MRENFIVTNDGVKLYFKIPVISVKPYELLYLKSTDEARRSNPSLVTIEDRIKFNEINARARNEMNNFCSAPFIAYLNALYQCQLYITHSDNKLRWQRYTRYALGKYATLNDAWLLVKKLDVTKMKTDIKSNKT